MVQLLSIKFFCWISSIFVGFFKSSRFFVSPCTKCSDHRTISLISHTAKILRRRIERKIEYVLGEDQFGFRRGKETRDAIGMLRIIAEQTLEIDEELCIRFIDWHKAFDRVN